DAWHGQAELWGFGGPNSTDDFQVTIQDERGVEWLEWMRSFIHDDGYGYHTQDYATDFASGLPPGWRGSTASLTSQTVCPHGAIEIGTAYMLTREGEERQVPTGGSGLSLVRSFSQDRQDACVELFRFLAQPEQSATWHLGTGYVP